MEAVALALAGSATALATGLGALPVSHLGERAESLRPGLWGLTVGLMTVASVVGLLMPALDDGSVGTVGAGLALGVVFLLVSRRLLEARDVHVGRLRGAGVRRSAGKARTRPGERDERRDDRAEQRQEDDRVIHASLSPSSG